MKKETGEPERARGAELKRPSPFTLAAPKARRVCSGVGDAREFNCKVESEGAYAGLLWPEQDTSVLDVAP